LASTHFNENLCRDKKVPKTGEQYDKVVWPKYKDGEVVVKERSIPPAYVEEQNELEAKNAQTAIGI